MRKVKQDQNIKTEEGKKRKASEQEVRERNERDTKRKQDKMVYMNPNFTQGKEKDHWTG